MRSTTLSVRRPVSLTDLPSGNTVTLHLFFIISKGSTHPLLDYAQCSLLYQFDMHHHIFHTMLLEPPQMSWYPRFQHIRCISTDVSRETGVTFLRTISPPCYLNYLYGLLRILVCVFQAIPLKDLGAFCQRYIPCSCLSNRVQPLSIE